MTLIRIDRGDRDDIELLRDYERRVQAALAGPCPDPAEQQCRQR